MKILYDETLQEDTKILYDETLQEDTTKRIIENVFDVIENRLIDAKEFFSRSEGEIIAYRRRLEEAVLLKEPLFICPHCKQMVKISGRKTEKGQASFFSHLYDSDECEIKTTTQRTKEEIEAEQYGLIGESKRHKELKNFIGTYLQTENSKNLGFDNVCISKRIKSEIPYLNWRCPDVLTTFMGRDGNEKKIVFEIQLSTTFLSVVVDRDIFYRLNGYYIIWVFNFENIENRLSLGNLLAKDIYYANKRNVFILDQAAMEKSKEENKLYLSVTWLDDTENFVDPVLVSVDELSFDEQKFKPYYFDAESQYLENHPEEEKRISSLERDRADLLRALMIKQKKEEEKEQRIKEAIERRKEEIRDKGTCVTPYTKSKKWGYEYESTIMTLPKYSAASPINEEGYGFVTRSRRKGVVNRFGEEIVPCDFRSIQLLSNNTFLVDDSEYWSIFKGAKIERVKKGDVVTASRLNENLVLIKIAREKENVFAISDADGLAQVVDGAEPFDGDTAIVTAKGYWKPGESYRSGGYWYHERRTYSSGRKFLITRLGHMFPKDYDCSQDIVIARNLAGKTGLLNRSLEPVSDFSYSSISLKGDNIADVQKDQKHGLLIRDNVSGRFSLKVPCLYDTIDIIDDGSAKVSINGKYGIINLRNEIVVPLDYMSIGDIAEDGYNVMRNSIWGKCDKQGKEIIEEKQELVDGLYRGKLFGRYGIIDIHDKTIIEFNYFDIQLVGDSHFLADRIVLSKEGDVICKDVLKAAVTSTGLLICNSLWQAYLFKNNCRILAEYDIISAEILDNRIDLALRHDKKGAISLEGEILQEEVTYLGNGISKYREMGYWRLSSEDKSVEFPTKYENIVELGNGNLVLAESSGFSIKGKNGTSIFETSDIRFIKRLNDRLLLVGNNHLFGCCNNDGEIVQKCIFSKISDFENGCAQILYNGRTGTISIDGEFIPDLIEPLSSNNTKQRILGLWGIKNDSGKWLYDAEFSKIVSAGNRYILVSDNHFVIIDESCAEIKKVECCRFERIFGDSLIEISNNGKYGISNMDGSILYECSYTRIDSISCGYLRTCRIERSYSWRQPDFTYYGLIDPSGSCIFSCEKRNIEILNESIIHVEYKGRHSGYSLQNEKLYEFYQSYDLKNGYRKISNAGASTSYGKWGVIDSCWRLIIPCHFDDVAMPNTMWVTLKKNGKWGCVSIDLKESFPCKYPNIVFNNDLNPCVRMGDKLVKCQDFVDRSRLEVNHTYSGKVIEIREYGLMLKIESQKCLLHISEIKKLRKKPDNYSIGDTIKVVVKAYDKEKKRYSLVIARQDSM